MKEFILFVLSYLLILLIYEVFIVRRAKKDIGKIPVEVKFLINRYGIELDKINYNQVLQVVALLSSFDIALVGTIMSLFDNFFITLLVGFSLLIPIILISYMLVGTFYKRRMNNE